jgi:hypothetical protein
VRGRRRLKAKEDDGCGGVRTNLSGTTVKTGQEEVGTGAPIHTHPPTCINIQTIHLLITTSLAPSSVRRSKREERLRRVRVVS